MNLCGCADLRLLGRARGSILVELVVAIAILGLFLGGLSRAFHGTCESAVKLREKAGEASGSPLEDSLAQEWTWGPMVDDVEWGPGPELFVGPGRGCKSEAMAGVWCDGWLLGEWPLPMDEALRLRGDIWMGRSGREVVVRARTKDTGWGAPWRTVVPDVYGGNVGVIAESAAVPGVATGFYEAEIVMHTRTMGFPPLESTWSATPVSAYVQGLVLVLQGCGSGVSTLESDGRVQSWLNHEGRRLDVFW